MPEAEHDNRPTLLHLYFLNKTFSVVSMDVNTTNITGGISA